MSLPASLRRAFLACLLALAGMTASHAEPVAGDVPPPRLGRNLAGDEILIPGYAGKAVVLTFWATWCPYCLKELPILDNVQRRAGPDRLRVVAVNTEDRDVFRQATRMMRKAMAIELVSDADGQAARAFGVTVLPHMVIVGRDGRIVRVYRGYSEDSLKAIVADINLALASPPASAPAP